MIAEYRPPGRAKFFTEALLEVRGDSSAANQPPDIRRVALLPDEARWEEAETRRPHYRARVLGSGRWQRVRELRLGMWSDALVVGSEPRDLKGVTVAGCKIGDPGIAELRSIRVMTVAMGGSARLNQRWSSKSTSLAPSSPFAPRWRQASALR
eukprot:scaffold57143_cov38-Phaeocystis_antarctica.AAC.2